MIWDVHCHFPRNWEQPDADRGPLLDSRAQALRDAGVVRASLLSGGRFGPSYEEALEQARRHEDLFVPIAVVDLDASHPREIARLHDMGYRGLKVIGPRLAYDDHRYFGIYQEAEARGLPILFHLGVIGGGVDYSITHPRRDPEAAQTYRRVRRIRDAMPRDMSAIRMRPFHLDTIANNFPDLGIIGAHMGGTGNYDEASSVARWRHNVHFDLSGGDTIERHSVERGLIGKEIGIEKLVWGSDCGDAEIGEHVRRFEQIFDDLALSDEEQRRIWYDNAAELFGERERTFAVE